MKVRILQSCLATIDGFEIRKFITGEVYDLREFIATNLINQRKAEFISDEVEQDIEKT